MTATKEQFANFATSTLAADVAAGAVSFDVADASVFPASGQFRIVVDREIFLVTNVTGNTLSVIAGYENTPQTDHASGAAAKMVLTSALMAAMYPNGRVVTTAGDVQMASDDSVVEINKITPQATVVSLPTDPVPFRMYGVVDGAGNSGAYPITVQGLGATVDSLATGGVAKEFYWNGTAWRVSTSPAGQLAPVAGRDTTGDTTLLLTDHNSSLVSQDGTPVNLILPAGLPRGFRVRSYQGASGQITYVAGLGATVMDGALRSLGVLTLGYFVDIENVGSDRWVVLGNTTPGLLNWNIVGQSSIGEGDNASVAIWRPDAANAFAGGVALRVTGTGFTGAGLSPNLVDAMTKLAQLDAGVTFDGVDTLTILPAARNPLPLNFFATPTYSAVGDRSVSVSITPLTAGSGSVGTGSLSIAVRNTSRPVDPSELIRSVSTTAALLAPSGGNTITLASSAGVSALYTVTGHASIPAGTWVTAVNGNIVTLSANLTGDVPAATALTLKQPGIWFKFSTTAGLTLDGSNRCSAATEKFNGYQVTNSGANTTWPVYQASQLNGKGGLAFNLQTLSTTTAAPLINLLDTIKTPYTLIMVTRCDASSGLGYYAGMGAIDGPKSNSDGALYIGGAKFMDTPDSAAMNRGIVWSVMHDGRNTMMRQNGQRVLVPAVLATDWVAGTLTCDFVDLSSVQPNTPVLLANNSGLKATRSDVQGQNYGNLKGTISGSTMTWNVSNTCTTPAGTTVHFMVPFIGNPPQTAHTSTNFKLGGPHGSGNLGKFTMFEFILVPRLLSAQEWKGVHLYLENEYGTSFTKTTSASSAAGGRAVTLSDVSGVQLYQTVSGTGVKAGSTVVKVNQTTKVVTLDEALTGTVSSGATLTLHECAFKRPDVLDVGSSFDPTFRDDFALGAKFANSGTGWQPYYGSVTNPGTYGTAYSSAGHGSCNSAATGNTPASQYEWNLDVLNYTPWLQYNPYSSASPADAATGEMVMTARKTPDAIANSIGYFPPQPGAYPCISAYMKSAGAFAQQFGYFEARVKVGAVGGGWPAWWLTAWDGVWPPEIDILEAYGNQTSSIYQTLHQTAASNFGVNYLGGQIGMAGDIQLPIEQEYVLLGCEVSPTAIDFYVNREKSNTVPFRTGWDFWCPFFLQLNLGMTNALDEGVEVPYHVDYCAVWRRKPQTPTVPTATQAETTALLAAMSVQPSSGRQALINTLIASLKSYVTSWGQTPEGAGQTLWGALDFLYLTAAHDAQAARVNWKNPAQVATVVGTPTFTADQFYAGVTGASYLDTGVNLSTSGYQCTGALNQLHIGAVVWGTAVGTTNPVVGTTTGDFKLMPQSSGSLTSALLSGARTISTGGNTGHFVATRNHFHNAVHYRNAVMSRPVSGSDSHVVDNENILLANGQTRVSCAHGGDYLSPDDIGYLYTLLYNYLHALGAL